MTNGRPAHVGERAGAARETAIMERLLLHTTVMPVRWGDMDALGHVNNIVYLQYFEQCRVDWKERNGYRLTQKEEGMILLKSTVTYRKPVVYPADVRVTLYAGDVRRSSFTLLSEIHLEDSSAALCTEAEFVIVWYDYRTGKTARLPDGVRALLSGDRE